VSIEPNQTEDPPKQYEREHIWVFFRKFWVVSICFGLLRNSSVGFGCFGIGSRHRNKPKSFVETPKQTETDLVSVCFGSNGIFYVEGHSSSVDRSSLKSETWRFLENSASSCSVQHIEQNKFIKFTIDTNIQVTLYKDLHFSERQ
jgi:hypothetical protein